MRTRKAGACLVASAALVCLGVALGSARPVARAQAHSSSTPALGPTGIRETSWSPDGKRLAVTWFDAVWTMAPDGRDLKRVVKKAGEWVSERDPAWSADRQSIAFSVDSAGEFDVWIAPANGARLGA